MERGEGEGRVQNEHRMCGRTSRVQWLSLCYVYCTVRVLWCSEMEQSGRREEQDQPEARPRRRRRLFHCHFPELPLYSALYTSC